MEKGMNFHNIWKNNWLMSTLALLILMAIIGLASLSGGLSLEVGGLQMTLDLAANDGAYVSFVNAG